MVGAVRATSHVKMRLMGCVQEICGTWNTHCKLQLNVSGGKRLGVLGRGTTCWERTKGDGEGLREGLAVGLPLTGDTGLWLRLALGVRLRVMGDGLWDQLPTGGVIVKYTLPGAGKVQNWSI